MPEKLVKRFQPRHIVGLAAIAAFTVLMQPVASQAAGSLISIADGTTNAVAKVDSAGNLAVSTHSADRPVKVFDSTLQDLMTIGGVVVNVAGYRGVQVYAYPYNPGITASPTTNTLTVTTAFVADKTTTAPEASIPLGAWSSGTLASKRSGPVQQITLDTPAPALRFVVTQGGYYWRVVIFGWR